MPTRTLAEEIDDILSSTRDSRPKVASAPTGTMSRGELLHSFANVLRAVGNRPVTLDDFHAVKSASVPELTARRAELVTKLASHTEPLHQLADAVRIAGIDDDLERRTKIAKAIVARRALSLLQGSR